MDKAKKFFRKLLCFMGQHEVERICPERGLAGGFRCKRPGCGWKIDPIEWPDPEPRPK